MSRASIVGMLIAVEVLIVGIAVYVIGGAGWHPLAPGAGFFGGAFHRVAFAAEPIAPIAVGTSPEITVDDPDSRVVVLASSDGQVHVKDLTTTRGSIFSQNGKIEQLQVTHDGNKVTISRPGQHLSLHVFMFGLYDRRIEIDAPRDSRVSIAHCAGADVSDVGGPVDVYSEDGHITLSNLSGAVDARSDDGYIEATGVHGDSLTLQSGDGHLAMRDISVGSLTATTDDGRIDAIGLTVAGAKPAATLHSGDGSVRVRASFAPAGNYAVTSDSGSVDLALASDSNLTINASTGDGSIVVDGSHVDSDDDSSSHTIRLGDGSGSLKVSSGDGSIHITTNNGVL